MNELLAIMERAFWDALKVTVYDGTKPGVGTTTRCFCTGCRPRTIRDGLVGLREELLKQGYIDDLR